MTDDEMRGILNSDHDSDGGDPPAPPMPPASSVPSSPSSGENTFPTFDFPDATPADVPSPPPTASTDGGDASGAAPTPRPHRRRMSAAHIRRIKRRRMIRRILLILLIVLVALGGLAAWFGSSALKVRDEVNQAVTAAKRVQSSIERDGLSGMGDGIDEFCQHVHNAYDQTRTPLWDLATAIPYFGTDIDAVRTAVTAMENTASQALPALKQAASTLDPDSIGIADGTVNLPDMTDLTEQLAQADRAVGDSAEAVRSAHAHIPAITNALDTATQYLDRLSDLTHNASIAAQLLPKMLAMDGQTRTYLILAETNAEIRPSGGMPGSWGSVSVIDGHIEFHDFVSAGRDIGEFDEPVVDLSAEERSLFTDKLARVPQDVNFTPDFPRTGQIARAMWAARTGVEVDGVIAVDPVFLQNMLAVTGGVTLSDGAVLDGSNAARYLLSSVYALKSVDEQDDYFSMAASAAFSHIMSNADGLGAYVKAVNDSVQDGHLMLWCADADEQKLVGETAMSGRLVTEASQPQTGVYFSDITQSKMDWYLRREVSLEHQKTSASGAEQYTLRIRLTNTLDAAQAAVLPQYVKGGNSERQGEGQIETAVFVYAPAGGRLVDWTMSDGAQFDGVSVHDGLTVGTRTVTLEPGQSYEIVCHVQSAPGVVAETTLRQTPLMN